MEQPGTRSCLEQVVLPHLDAAYNLARWLAGDPTDAEDIVQEACLRAVAAFGGYRGTRGAEGEEGRAWLLAIVRNTAYTWLRKHRKHQPETGMDEELGNVASEDSDPEMILIQQADQESRARALASAMERLPAEFREVIVLREQEGLSYKEIADVSEVPVGTVMSRLARARRQLQQLLRQEIQGGARGDARGDARGGGP